MAGGFCPDAENGIDRHFVDLGEGLGHHLAAGCLPFVVLLEEHGADQTHDGRLVGEYSDDIGTPFDLLVQSLDRVGRIQFRPVLPRE